MQARLAQLVLKGLKEARVRVVTALPDTLLKGVYEAAARDPDFRYVPATNEGEGAAIAAGAWSAGQRAVLVMEASGIRVASEMLARLGFTHGFPVPIMMGYRGDVGEGIYWGTNQGITLEPMLNALRIPYLLVDREEDIPSSVVRTVIHAVNGQHPAAVIFRHPLVEGD